MKNCNFWKILWSKKNFLQNQNLLKIIHSVTCQIFRKIWPVWWSYEALTLHWSKILKNCNFWKILWSKFLFLIKSKVAQNHKFFHMWKFFPSFGFVHRIFGFSWIFGFFRFWQLFSFFRIFKFLPFFQIFYIVWICYLDF